MGRKFLKILSLQEYAKKKRRNRVELLEHESCYYCEFYRKENEVCIGGGNIKNLKTISYCPISRKTLKQIH